MSSENMPSVEKTDAEWQQLLTSEQYRLTRRKGTERAFSGEYWDAKARTLRRTTSFKART